MQNNGTRDVLQHSLFSTSTINTVRRIPSPVPIVDHPQFQYSTSFNPKFRRGMAPSSAVFSHYHQSVDFSSLAIRAGLAQPPRHASLLGSYFIEIPSRQRCALHHPPRTASVLYHLEKTGPKPNKGFTGHACIPSASVVF